MDNEGIFHNIFSHLKQKQLTLSMIQIVSPPTGTVSVLLPVCTKISWKKRPARTGFVSKQMGKNITKQKYTQ